MKGQAICATHGGKAPQALAKAEAALELAEMRLRGLAGQAVATLEGLLVADSETVRLGAARDLADRSIGKAVERVAVQANVVVRKPW